MSKLRYDKKIYLIRKLTRKILVEMLQEKPLTTKEIQNIIQKKYSENCDDSISCNCGRGGNKLEWQHQVAWAIQDVKYDRKIQYDKKIKKYSIVPKE